MTIPLTCRFPGAHVPSPPHLGVKRSHQRRGVGRGSRDPTIANTSTRLSAENFFHRSPHRLDFYAVLRKLIAKLQTFSQCVQETPMVRFYSSIYSDDKILISQMSRVSGFHGSPHQIAAAHRPKIEASAASRPRTAEPYSCRKFALFGARPGHLRLGYRNATAFRGISHVSGGGKTSDALAFRRWSDAREFQKSKEL